MTVLSHIPNQLSLSLIFMSIINQAQNFHVSEDRDISVEFELIS